MTEFRRDRPWWRACALALLLLVALPAFAASSLELRPDEVRRIAGRDVAYLADAAGALTPAEAAAAFAAARGTTLAGDIVAAPAARERHWLAVDLVNAGQEAGSWHLATRIPYRPEVAVFLARVDGRMETLLDTGLDTRFDARPVATRFLVSTPFTLAPGEAARILLRHRSAGPGALPISLEPPPRMIALAAADAAGTGFFYGAALAALAGFALFGLAMGGGAGLSHAGLFALALLLVAQIDGVAFQVIWPSWPRWNALAALPLALLACAVGLVVAARARPDWPHWRRACDALAILFLLAVAAVPVAPYRPLAHLAEAGLVLTIAAHAVVQGSLARQLEGLGWVFAGAAVAATVVAAWAVGMIAAGEPLPDWATDHPHRLVFLFILGVTMATVPGVSLRLRRAHEAALRREVAAAQTEAALNRRLFEAEKAYARARDLAAARKRDLAAASHDIRQPLVSLRLSLDAMAAGQEEATRQQLAAAFDYLEELLRDQLVERAAPAEAAPEPYPAAIVLQTIEQMFRDEAEAKGLRFASHPIEATISVPILPLVRLLSNLVANAVRHTAAGAVTIGCVPAAQSLVFEIADTGPGLAPEALEVLRQPGRKGEGSAGSGLGLAIVDELSAELGVGVAFETAPEGGTIVRVSVPYG